MYQILRRYGRLCRESRWSRVGHGDGLGLDVRFPSLEGTTKNELSQIRTQ